MGTFGTQEIHGPIRTHQTVHQPPVHETIATPVHTEQTHVVHGTAIAHQPAVAHVHPSCRPCRPPRRRRCRLCRTRIRRNCWSLLSTKSTRYAKCFKTKYLKVRFLIKDCAGSAVKPGAHRRAPHGGCLSL